LTVGTGNHSQPQDISLLLISGPASLSSSSFATLAPPPFAFASSVYPFSLLPPEHQGVQLLARVVFDVLHKVSVGIQRGLDAGVSHMLLQLLYVQIL